MDVFISYEHQSKSVADNICAVLESKGVRCWYAPRDVYGDYATSIVDAIEACKVFVLILSENASNSPHVLNEVEMAYKRIIEGEITIVPFKLDEGMLSKAMEYYVKRLHWIDAVSEPLEQSILKLYDQLVPILGLRKEEEVLEEKAPETNLQRKNVQYYSSEDYVEIKRLRKEDELLYEYELPVYDKLLFGKSDVAALDFDTLDPRSSMRRLCRPEISKRVCFCYNEDMVREGNDLCAEDPDTKFYHLDLRKDNVEEKIESAMRESGVKGFDFLNLTMAIMDLENPFKTLKKLKEFLNPGAVAFVRDVDDGVVFAFPDEDNLFGQFKEFYKLDLLSGSRYSARQVYNLMRKLGAKDIRLERCGLSSASMDFNKRRLLFDCWFGFIPNDFKRMLADNPSDEVAKDVLKWVDEHYDDLEEKFFDNNFLFHSGYFIYSVRF